MQRYWSCLAVAVVGVSGLPATGSANAAAPAASTGKAPASSADSTAAAIASPPRVKGSYMVPKAVVMRQMTPAEAEANAIWNVRAALNVAALQCQYSKYLATTPNYNAFLKHHSEEIARAQAVLIAHFKRFEGAKASAAFDTYLTKTYNSYSTLDAQYQFCEAAGVVGRRVLVIPKGKLGTEALLHMPEIRAAFVERPLSPALTVNALQPIPLAPISVPGA